MERHRGISIRIVTTTIGRLRQRISYFNDPSPSKTVRTYYIRSNLWRDSGIINRCIQHRGADGASRGVVTTTISSRKIRTIRNYVRSILAIRPSGQFDFPHDHDFRTISISQTRFPCPQHQTWSVWSVDQILIFIFRYMRSIFWYHRLTNISMITTDIAHCGS